MRCLRWFLILLVLASIHVSAQDDDTNAGLCPIKPKLGEKPIQNYWLHGTIGDKAARMHLERDGNIVIAVFYFTESTWTPTILGGHWNNGEPTATDKTEDKPATGQLTGSLTTRGFAGSWTPARSRFRWFARTESGNSMRPAAGSRFSRAGLAGTN